MTHPSPKKPRKPRGKDKANVYEFGTVLGADWRLYFKGFDRELLTVILWHLKAIIVAIEVKMAEPCKAEWGGLVTKAKPKKKATR